jgi:Flp pilus assembly secretin CpaC/tetratricopeptide (TPR) repeat protein
MTHLNQLRAFGISRRLAVGLLCCLAVLTRSEAALVQTEATQGQDAGVAAQKAPSQTESGVPSQPVENSGTATTVVAVGASGSGPVQGKRQLREAESAYLSGAKKLEHDDLNAAEIDFQRALKLDPANRNYAIAISVARQHRLNELVQQATKARQTGDQEKAETLLAEARSIDPDNPIVLEHSGPFYVSNASAPQTVAALGQTSTNNEDGRAATATLADRAKLIAGAEGDRPSILQAPVLAGAIHLTPIEGVKSFHLRGASADVLRQVAGTYGINAAVDDSVDRKNLRFDLENVTYQKAMEVLLSMTHTFAATVDETGIVVARDDATNRGRLEPQLQETIYVPGYSAAEITELVSVAKNIFGVKQIDTSQGNIVVRAPENVLDPLNRTLQDLINAAGEVMVEVKLYEVDMTHMVNAGGNVPTQFSVFNVDQAANQVVNANQTIVQQAIAQGLVPPGTSNLEIALALINLGLVKSSLAANLIGVIGGGALQTGISASTNTTFNLGLNSTDTRALDDVQQRVGDHQAATFREGTRYPIVSSSYSTGLSTAGSALGNATINGVSVASLLQQYAGGTSATIPQVTYEDLGVTLKATPVIQRSGQISLSIDLKIEALSGSTNDGNPVLNNRQFTSGLTVGDGESVLMVSNVSKTELAAMTGIPGLSELPGFQMPTEDNAQKDSSQLVVLVTPHIVRRPPDLLLGPRIPVPAQAMN